MKQDVSSGTVITGSATKDQQHVAEFRCNSDARTWRRQLLGGVVVAIAICSVFLGGASAFAIEPALAHHNALIAQQMYRCVWERKAVVGDVTNSVRGGVSPNVQTVDIEPWIAAIQGTCGGEIGVIVVTSRVMGGLVRLRIEPAAPMPVMPDTVHATVYEKRDRMRQFVADFVKWQEGEVARRAMNTVRSRAFRDSARLELQPNRGATPSDVVGALQRADRFLSEPVPGGGPSHLTLLVSSDLHHNVGGRGIYTFASHPETAWVYRATPPLDKLPGLNPVLFESLSSAVAWLNRQPTSTAGVGGAIPHGN